MARDGRIRIASLSSQGHGLHEWRHIETPSFFLTVETKTKMDAGNEAQEQSRKAIDGALFIFNRREDNPKTKLY